MRRTTDPAPRPTTAARSLLVRGLAEPPSLNHAYRNVPGRGRVLTEDARAYKAAAVLVITNAAQLAGFRVPRGAPLRLTFRFWFANPARDGDNAVKLVQDAAAAALGFNDRWVMESGWHKLIDPVHPRCDLEIAVL